MRLQCSNIFRPLQPLSIIAKIFSDWAREESILIAPVRSSALFFASRKRGNFFLNVISKINMHSVCAAVLITYGGVFTVGTVKRAEIRAVYY